MFSTSWKTLQRKFAHFFPPACAGCNGSASSESAFCSICRPLAHRLSPPHCARCQVPMNQLNEPTGTKSECSRCQRRPPHYESVSACWEYDDAVADAIRRIKYGADLAALRSLCRGARPWFQGQLEAFSDDIPIVAIPSHRRELRRRGFHVPSLALRMVCNRNQVRRIEGMIEKTTPTVRQASLSFEQRRKNVRDVFCYVGPDNPGGPVLLFDDVLTTGATVDAASAVLRAAGFDKIEVIVLARAPKGGLY